MYCGDDGRETRQEGADDIPRRGGLVPHKVGQRPCSDAVKPGGGRFRVVDTLNEWWNDTSSEHEVTCCDSIARNVA